MQFNAIFPPIPLTPLPKSGAFWFRHEESERLLIKSPIADPIGTFCKVLIGEEPGVRRSGSRYYRKVNILLFLPEPDLPTLTLAIASARGILRLDRCEVAYFLPLGDEQFLTIQVF